MASPLFRSLEISPPTLVEVIVDGQAMRLPDAMPLAAALLNAGIATFHHSVRADEPRGPLCLMGSCFQCVAVVDGVVNQRTCRLPVRAGMVIELRTPPLPEGAA